MLLVDCFWKYGFQCSELILRTTVCGFCLLVWCLERGSPWLAWTSLCRWGCLELQFCSARVIGTYYSAWCTSVERAIEMPGSAVVSGLMTLVWQGVPHTRPRSSSFPSLAFLYLFGPLNLDLLTPRTTSLMNIWWLYIVHSEELFQQFRVCRLQCVTLTCAPLDVPTRPSCGAFTVSTLWHVVETLLFNYVSVFPEHLFF